ncbi:MAG: hypothetical protein IJX88_06460 [Clostridia bacterium]|nr:hypothetical protein [Clostridia bacterium]
MKKRIVGLLACLLAVSATTSLSACGGVSIGFLDSLTGGGSSESSSSGVNGGYGQSSKESSSKTSSKEESSEHTTSSDSQNSSAEQEVEKPTKEIDFTPRAKEEKYGYQALGKEENGTAKQRLYASLLASAQSFWESDKDVVKSAQGAYLIDDGVNYSGRGLTRSEAVAVWTVFRTDYPEFWWIRGEIAYSNADLYMTTDEAYILHTTRETIYEKTKEFALDCYAYAENATNDFERAWIVYDYLAVTIDYAYEANGVTPSDETWAHDIVGSVLYKKGVCETYAETYAWLAELLGLDCIVVKGVAGLNGGTENHAWNMVEIGGVWYNVDATWGDVIDDRGNKLVHREWFGMGKAEFDASHVATAPTPDYGISYQVALPTASETYLCPAYLQETGGEKQLVYSIDEAFKKITNEQGRYEITLYIDSVVTSQAGSKLYPFGATFTAALPKAKSLTFIGKKVYVAGAGQYYGSDLSHTGVATLACNITLKDLTFDTSNVVYNGYTLVRL